MLAPGAPPRRGLLVGLLLCALSPGQAAPTAPPEAGGDRPLYLSAEAASPWTTSPPGGDEGEPDEVRRRMEDFKRRLGLLLRGTSEPPPGEAARRARRERYRPRRIAWAQPPDPPEGLAGEALAAWMREDHRACLEAVLGRRPGPYRHRDLVRWLARHGDLSAVPYRRGYLPYSRRELRALKDDSARGSVASAMVLADAYRERSRYEWEPSSHLEMPAYLPWALVMQKKTRDYQSRIRRNAARRLRRLERRR